MERETGLLILKESSLSISSVSKQLVVTGCLVLKLHVRNEEVRRRKGSAGVRQSVIERLLNRGDK